MNTDDPGDELPQMLWGVVGVLEVGDWRSVLRPPGFGGRVVAGARDLVHWAMALRLVARSMQLQTQGLLQEAWDRLEHAAAMLPPSLRHRDAATDTVLVVLEPEPLKDASVETQLAWRIARLVWREQYELDDLRRTFAERRMTPRKELTEACIQYQFWVEFDPFTWYHAPPGEGAWDDGTTVERSRSVLCRRGTELRWFANPTENVALSQAPWQDVGGYRGLYALALDTLAKRAEPAPWCGVDRIAGLPVRCGRLRAWQHARQRHDDIDSAP